MTHMPAPMTDRLRYDIDDGAGREQMPVTDAAVAPLGADDEAPGTLRSRRRSALAQAREIADPTGGTDEHAVSLYVSVAAAIILSIVAAIYLIPIG